MASEIITQTGCTDLVIRNRRLHDILDVTNCLLLTTVNITENIISRFDSPTQQSDCHITMQHSDGAKDRRK